MNHVLCCNGKMDVSVYGVKPLKAANTLQPLQERFRLDAGAFWSWGKFSWHSMGSLIIVEGTMDKYKYASVLADHIYPIYEFFTFRMVTYTSGTMRSVTQLAVYVSDLKSPRISLPFYPGQQTHLI
ncbi:hypothetical protein TNCV_4934841 [Trichonephila clavipes]|uniref:Uncharacterized protein n=1 Tax=Trichonephila clavipes TaxID=2585209 RepID=A0A8X6SJ64_TRICX|nr:hypothetical protein TNCV_4934841 [Trichonephila clavipes]